MSSKAKLGRLTSKLIRSIGDNIAPKSKGNGRLCILNFHRVLASADPFLESEPDTQTFRWQMELLASCFNVMPLKDAIYMLAKERMPPRAVCITFDDGYRSMHDHALPILKEFNLPATVFATSGFLDGTNMWNDRIIEAIRHIPTDLLDLRDVGLGVHSLETTEARKRVIHKLTDDAKYLPPDKRLDLTLQLEALVGHRQTDSMMLTPEMLLSLSQNNVDIGGHTITHPILTSLTDKAARSEITGNKQHLEAIISKPVTLFAYPNGKAGMDFDERHVAMAKDAGFDAAFTTAYGAATSTHQRYQIPRCRPWDSTPFFYAARLLRWLAQGVA